MLKDKLKSVEEGISLISFSFLVLILMIIVPLVVIKSSPVGAAEENKINSIEDMKTGEEGVISLSGSETIKVYITKEDKVIEVPLEDYVKSVVSGEMPASFDFEALKAQSVAARTYVAAKRGRPCDEAKGGDVCDTTHCQVYISKESRLEKWGNKGSENWEKISRAVDETKGKVLSYNNELVQYPQFFSTSSGRTENSIDVFSGDIPYLVSTESKGEEAAPKYVGEFKFDTIKFINEINSRYPNAKLSQENLQDNIEILSRSDAGGVKEIRIGKVKIKGMDLRLALGLNSANFEFKVNDKEIVFNCKGYGHGVGMSQWGANAMAKEGNSYEEILKHYYTGIELREVEFN